jgi:hypothetical protein
VKNKLNRPPMRRRKLLQLKKDLWSSSHGSSLEAGFLQHSVAL